jgi:hypothetical protein
MNEVFKTTVLRMAERAVGKGENQARITFLVKLALEGDKRALEALRRAAE